jgi:hypothetical protein
MASRQPENETLHRLVREHLRTLYAAVEHGFEGANLPDFVRADLEGYIKCGALNRGFAHLQCKDCQRPLLVAFSCGSRGFCPSCLGRWMCQGALNLLAYVHGLSPRKSLGQNFLVDPHVPERIVAAVELGPDDTVVEIGAGLGALTARLLGRAHQVIAIERDPHLAEILRAELGAQEGLRLVEGDALEFDWVAAARAAGRPLVVVGNLPYVVTSPVIFAILGVAGEGRVIDRALFMVQKEFAQRMLSPPGSRVYGRLSVMVRLSPRGRATPGASPWTPPASTGRTLLTAR